ncbi:MAG: carbohydrate kinase family protein [Clostridiales bacterium]|nr:carbohydrate kinase family protein [Clostridiales bacterium]
MDMVVVGVVFLDIKGFPFFKYDAVGTNLGNVLMTHGGVARNVAVNMANLGAEVEFVTMLDDDSLGREARLRLRGAGVKLTHAVSTPDKGMGMWLAVFNEKGDLAGSVSHMPDASPIERLFDEKGEEIIRSCRGVALEIDLSEKVSERVFELAERFDKPVYAIVANMSVILRRPDFMARTACVILNEIEAGRLFGREIRALSPEETLEAVSEAAPAMGIRSIVVTMGARGAVYLDAENGLRGVCPAVPCRVVDTTGAGDAFFSAVVESLARGMRLDDAVTCGARLASMTVSTSESTCPHVDEHFFGIGE